MARYQLLNNNNNSRCDKATSFVTFSTQLT